MNKLRVSFAAAVLLLMAGPANAVNLAVNGGFETGDFSGWQTFPSGTQPVGGFDPTEGSFAARLFNDVPASASLIKNANIGVGVVTPGAMLEISFDARGATAAGGVAFAELFSEIAGGGTSASQILGGGPLALNADPAVWTSFTFMAMAGPDVSGGITIQLAAITGADPSSVSDIYFDNLQVRVVPVPAAVWLFASGLGVFGWLKRRAA